MRSRLTFKKVLTIIVIPVFGYVLLLATFMLAAIFRAALFRIFRIGGGPEETAGLLVGSWRLLFMALMLLVSWFILRSKLPELYKAVYAAVPVAVVMTIVGIYLNRWPAAVYAVDALIYGGIILYLYKAKKSWVYYYAVTWITAALLFMMAAGIDI